MTPSEATGAITAGFKFFALSGLKGRPNVESRDDFNQMVSIWAEALADVPAEVFVAACKSLSGQLTFYPALSEVRQRCLEMMHGKPKQALEIWAEIKRSMMAVCHTYANPEDRQAALDRITCPVAREAAEKFDWLAFGKDDESNESHHKHQFEKLFNSIRDRRGIEAESERFGLPAPGSVGGLIGEVVKKIGRRDS